MKITTLELKVRLAAIQEITISPDVSGFNHETIQYSEDGFEFKSHIEYTAEFFRKGKITRTIGDRNETEYLMGITITQPVEIVYVDSIKIDGELVESVTNQDEEEDVVEVFNQILQNKFKV